MYFKTFQHVSGLSCFLAKEQFTSSTVKLAWTGKIPLENTLYFAQRKKAIYTKEPETLQKIFIKEFE